MSGKLNGMKIFVLLPLLIVLGMSYSTAQDAKSELRTWTAVNGKEVEAEFVSNSDGQVSLKMKTGKIFKVPLNKLSKADQEFISENAPESNPEESFAKDRERRIMGYWLVDLKKTLETLKVLEANAPDDLLKQKYGRVIKSMKGELPRDHLPVALKAKFIIHFEEGGETKIFVEGSELGVGTYSIIDVKDASSSWRIDCDFGKEEKFSMTLDGSTLRMNPPAVGGAEEAFPIPFSRTDKFVPKIRPKLEGVNEDELEHRDGLVYTEGSNTPYTGKVYELHSNGQKEKEGNFKDGKMDGLWVGWHKNGQKAGEGNFKDGKLVEGSEKWWNSKGEPVDSRKEAFKE